MFAAAVVATPTSARAEEPRAPAWDDAPDWGFEARAGALYGLRSPFGQRGAESELGTLASVGFVRRLPYTPHRVGQSSEKGGGDEVADVFIGVFTLGLAWIPPSVWYGTEIGASAELQYRAGLDSLRDRWVAAVRPSFRISPGSRLRYPAIVSLFAPAVGVAVDTPRPGAGEPEQPGTETSFYLGPQLFPFSVLVDRHVAFEVEPAAPIVVRLSDGKAAINPALTASVVFR